MRARAKEGINFDKDCDALPTPKKTNQQRNMQAVQAYTANIRRGTYEDIADLVDMEEGGDWEQGQSQEKHDMFMNVRGYDTFK